MRQIARTRGTEMLLIAALAGIVVKINALELPPSVDNHPSTPLQSSTKDLSSLLADSISADDSAFGSIEESAHGLSFPFPNIPAFILKWLKDFVEFRLKAVAYNNLNGTALSCAKEIFNITEHGGKDAFDMLDALGKPKAGIQRGAGLWLGDFDMCYAVQNYSVHYCIARVGKAENEHNFTYATIQTTLGLGLCVPAKCSASDLNAFLNLYIDELVKLGKLKLGMKVYGTQCNFPAPWDAPTLAVFIGGGVFVLLSLLASFFVVLVMKRRRSRSNSLSSSLSSSTLSLDDRLPYTIDSTLRPSAASAQLPLPSRRRVRQRVNSELYRHDTARVQHDPRPVVLKIVSLFDPFTNLHKVFSPYPGPHLDNTLNVIDGLRTLSMVWLVVKFVFFMSQLFISNPYDLFENESNQFLYQIIFSSTFALDTFLLLSGMKFALRMFGRYFTYGKFGINFLWVLLYRYIGLMPVYGAFILIWIYILPHLVVGPYTTILLQSIGNPIENCMNYWWTNVLFINNYYPVIMNQRCLDWAGYVALEVQLFVASPILIYLIAKVPVVGILTSLGLIGGPIAARTLLSLKYGMPITWNQAQIASRVNQTDYNPDYEYTQFAIYTRADSYVIGILCAYFLARFARYRSTNKYGNAWRFNKFAALIIWAITSGGAAFAVFCTFQQNTAQAMGLTWRTVWFAAARPVFTVFVAWIIIATTQFGLGGPIGAILGHAAFRPLARWTFGVFLCHVAAIQFILTNQRDAFYFHDVNMVALSVLLIVGSYALGGAISLLFESPFRRLARLMQGTTTTAITDDDDDDRSSGICCSLQTEVEPAWDELSGEQQREADRFVQRTRAYKNNASNIQGPPPTHHVQQHQLPPVQVVSNRVIGEEDTIENV